MPAVDSREYIKEKINALKEAYPSLRTKSDDYVFSVLCVKSNFYKNPSLELTEAEMLNMIVDGVGDGGIDALLSDPNSEESNLVLCQSKYYENISFEQVRDAVVKMALFYKDMIQGNYSNVNDTVQRRFLTLNAEVGEESKICFVFYTSASSNRIRRDRVEKALKETLNNCCNYELNILFDDDVVDEIKESESRRPTIETGKIMIDDTENILYYGDDAIIVNTSAFSIKELYALHNTNLLSQNLRFHIAGRDIDQAIAGTIRECPDTFWFKNNGLTIVCDDFDPDGRYIKLHNFSIVNGGQTTYMLHKSKEINRDNDLYLPCKIIRIIGDTEDEKRQFNLDIAKATNSQKAIKQVDLKANSPEQIRFANEMRAVGIFYQTKRGEKIPDTYKDSYKNTDLAEVGKLSLAAIFQLPASSRSKPSTMYNALYYDLTFDRNQHQIANLMKELLYIDDYFKNGFLKRFDRENVNPVYPELIPFAHNARTLCVAFVAFAARYKQGNISNDDLRVLFERATKDGAYANYFYDIFKNIDNLNCLFPEDLFANKDNYDEVLYQLFNTIIAAGRKCYSYEKEHNDSINETNYLKRDSNYYYILKSEWDVIGQKIDTIFSNINY